MNMDGSGNAYSQAVSNAQVDRFEITVLNAQLVGAPLPPPTAAANIARDDATFIARDVWTHM